MEHSKAGGVRVALIDICSRSRKALTYCDVDIPKKMFFDISAPDTKCNVSHFACSFSSTHIELSNARVMIRHHIRSRRPRIDVDMLITGSIAQHRTHVHVIERLSIHVVHVRVSLHLGRAHDLIQIREPRNIGKYFQRLHKHKLIKVACRDDCC